MFRVAGDQLFTDDQRNGRDQPRGYAIAKVDELERGEHIRALIGVAY